MLKGLHIDEYRTLTTDEEVRTGDQRRAEDRHQGDQSRAPATRLPTPGTVLQKKDRQGVVRCECTVEADGIHYQGTHYRSLSAAAMAASKDIGLGGRAQNGYLFWNLIKQPAREKDPVAALEKAWKRYESRAKEVMAANLSDDVKAKVLSAVREHAATLDGLQGQVA